MHTLSDDLTRAEGASAPSGRVKVWDPLVRIFHWSLVTFFTISWLTAEELDRVHEWTGWVVLGLVGFRLVWGLIGPRTARFSTFVRGPRATLAYLKDMAAGRAKRYLGHNPAGGAMIVILLAALVATVLTGWLSTTDALWGREWVEELHEGVANLTLALIGLHIAGVILSSLLHRENLVKAMITGYKRKA